MIFVGEIRVFVTTQEEIKMLQESQQDYVKASGDFRKAKGIKTLADFRTTKARILRRGARAPSIAVGTFERCHRKCEDISK